MPWSVFVHVSARLAPGADPARAAEHARACLRAEGLDDPASLARHQGVDGLPRLVWGSERLVGLTGDEDVFAARLAASLEGDLIAEARVSLGDPAAPEAEVMHAVRGALHALEGARDTMTAERAAALGSGWAELETWEQRASLVHVTLDHPVAALAPLWHALLVGAVDTPRFATGLRYAMVTALSELTRAAGGHPVELRDDELTRTVLDRVRAHLRAGGALPAPWWMLRPGSPADHDAYTQLGDDGAPGTSVEELLYAVFSAPREDAPRLALADAIRARNPARARAIDLGLEIAAHHRRGVAAPAAIAREHEALLATHGEVWAGPVHKIARRVILRRGFVEDLTLDADRLAELTARGTGPFAKAPGLPENGHLEACGLLDLEVSGAHGRIAEIDRRELSGLRSLRLPAQGLTDDDAEALAASQHLRGLRGLDLRANEIGWRGFRALAAGLRSLRWVDLGANSFDDPTSDDASPEVRGALIVELGPLPWLMAPTRRAGGGAPYAEQLDDAG